MPRTLADLPNYDFIDWHEPRISAWKKESLREEITMDLPSVFRTNSASASLAATKGGVGIARLPIALAGPEPDLVRILPEFDCAELDIWLVAHSDLRHTARIRAVWDHFVSQTIQFRQELPGIV